MDSWQWQFCVDKRPYEASWGYLDFYAVNALRPGMLAVVDLTERTISGTMATFGPQSEFDLQAWATSVAVHATRPERVSRSSATIMPGGEVERAPALQYWTAHRNDQLKVWHLDKIKWGPFWVTLILEEPGGAVRMLSANASYTPQSIIADLDRLIKTNGRPDKVYGDNNIPFLSVELTRWTGKEGIAHMVRPRRVPGKMPAEIVLRQLDSQLLCGAIPASIDAARHQLAAWRIDYNKRLSR